MSGLRVHTG